MSSVLIVDDEPSICWGLSRLALSLTLEAETASSAEKGLELAAANRPDLLILDVRLPGIDGLAAMDAFRRVIGDAPIILITAFGDLATAVRAVEQGAFEYVLKPFDLAEIRGAILRALQSRPAETSPSAPRDADAMIGQSQPMQAVFKRIALAAASDATVLLVGESGVGKELAARSIHRHSSRGNQPFVVVNVSALSPSLGDVELFGQSTGRSASDVHARGLVAQANGGTLFLDEVAELPPPLQAKLLRALEQGAFTPAGSGQRVASDLRVVAATRRDLKSFVNSGDFRQDLYCRLATFEIAIPPLRERRADVPLLAQCFVEQFGNAQARLSAETFAELEQRPWYGNVRELRNAIEHAVVLARHGEISPSYLPAPLPPLQRDAQDPDGRPPNELAQSVAALANALLDDPAVAGEVYERFLRQIEPPLLAAALHKCGRRCAPAARALGLHRTTLKRKLDQYGIDEVPA